MKWLIENNNEDALEVLHLIIQKKTKELQRKDPEVDVTDAIKSTIMSLIRREDSIGETIRRKPNDQDSVENITSKNENNEKSYARRQ